MTLLNSVTVGLTLCLMAAAANRGAEETALPNLLGAPGFENLEETFIRKGVVLEKNRSTAFRGWSAKCTKGKIRVSGDKKEVAEGETSLRIDFLSPGIENEGHVECGVRHVKPDTIYELGAMIKAYNVQWSWSLCRIHEYAKDGARVGGSAQRLLNYPTSPRFLQRKLSYVTGPRANRIGLMMAWKGRPQRVGVVRQPSVWCGWMICTFRRWGRPILLQRSI